MPTYAQLYQATTGESFESAMSGKAEREIEYTIYVKLNDLNELKKKAVSKERQEQWLVPLNCEHREGKLRIRLIDDIRPTMATKLKREGLAGVVEVEQDITMDMFKALRELSTGGNIKTRYTIPTLNRELQWEVDVFLSPGGSESSWVKVDLEVKDPNEPLPPFPFDHGRFIVDMGDMSHSDKVQIKKLWETEWLSMDQYK